MNRSCRNYLIATFVLAFIMKLFYIAIEVHPGVGDSSYYYILAENLASGRGFVVDFIGHYMSIPDQITHYANDYWMPLASVIMAIFMFVFGKSLFIALIPATIASLLTGYVTYKLAKFFTGSDFVSAVSAGIVIWTPTYSTFCIGPDSPVYYVLFVCSSLYFLITRRDELTSLILAAFLGGLAHLTRQDGVLLFITIIIYIAIIYPARKAIKYGLIATAAYVLTLSPLMVLNYVHLGTPLTGCAARTPFFTEYFDFYNYTGDISLRTFMDLGISKIIMDKIKVGLFNSKIIYKYLGSFLWIMALAGIGGWLIDSKKRVWRNEYLPPLILVVSLYLIYSFITTYISVFGGFLRSGMVMVPFAVIIAISTLRKYLNSSKIRWLAVIFLTMILISESSYCAYSLRKGHISMVSFQEDVINAIEEDADDDGRIIIMTRWPWEINHSFGYKTLQIPKGSPDTIYTVSKKYDANYLLVPLSLISFGDIYNGKVDDSRFTLLKHFEPLKHKLYKIN